MRVEYHISGHGQPRVVFEFTITNGKIVNIDI